MKFFGIGLAAAAFVGASFANAMPTSALPSRPEPTAAPSPTPAALPNGTSVLPIESNLFFVLDGNVSSRHSTVGSYVAMHLKDPLVLAGVTVAPAGTPGRLKILGTQHATAPDVNGTVTVAFDALVLPNGAHLPIRAAHQTWSVDVSVGTESTGQIMDTIKDIFIPYHSLYRMFRKGSDLELGPGTMVRARTGATLQARPPNSVVVVTPPPFNLDIAPAHSDFKPLPIATVPPDKPKHTPTPAPTATP